jgi:beta-1,2-mannobiose phosphorylase / 1,2-beta-oligomannan phosphorylase
MVTRHTSNPLLKPSDLVPTRPDFEIVCLLNPGVFRFEGKTWLIVRVAERPIKTEGKLRIAILNGGQTDILEIDETDPGLDLSDPREIRYHGRTYLSTLSHLRLLSSDDGVTFRESGRPVLHGENPQETFGIEDCRVASFEDGRFLLTYTAVSEHGYGVGLRVTRDWETFENLGMIISPSNKDCAIFEEKVNGQYVCLHRPSGVIVGGHFMWIGWSPDLKHWGNHICIAQSRPGHWDSARIGAGCAPIKTDKGWLVIYHGADKNHRYCLGAMLLDLNDPARVIARSDAPLMEPDALYEQQGFFGNVVFTNGHLVEGDTVTMYYGASDTVICRATMSIPDILRSLGV